MRYNAIRRAANGLRASGKGRQWLQSEARSSGQTARRNMTTALEPARVLPEGASVPTYGLIGLGVAGVGLFVGQNIQILMHNFELDQPGKTDGGVHAKMYRAEKKEQQPLTRMIGGEKSLDSHKRMASKGAFDKSKSFNKEPLTMRVLPDHMIARKMCDMRIESGVEQGKPNMIRSYSMASAGEAESTGGTPSGGFKRSMTRVDGISSFYD